MYIYELYLKRATASGLSWGQLSLRVWEQDPSVKSSSRSEPSDSNLPQAYKYSPGSKEQLGESQSTEACDSKREVV